MSKLGHLLLIALFSLSLIFLVSFPAWADVPTVTLQGPEEVRSGQPFSITVKIRHKGNNFIHHVSKLVIFVDGKEEKVWEYNWRTHPKEENWSISYQLTLKEKATVSAIATCNIHGPSKEPILLVAPRPSD